ncbi:MAG: Pyrophosphatase [Candidatus Collierbacteria bacterium GW2011_GWB1_44_6]|uniref:Pyrophosphatase n=2 Tax=Candidatus Collieribacteriota TaxID=1752725 RepID=A0A0G1JQR8_9BACT|nr:MAG: Pyrophosphatase [Candidatus Collierbacteria bacterium GW2011_GWC2_43_12]KKT73703.1 MAG: Pyrophosphatase [Candidatus Collierbacteria bacterium GW2011_GWB1_44_6]KKT83471.1 MAG: Pyrophosphatase [Microgenomates group bacterium GW2011_GWC1_44_9]
MIDLLTIQKEVLKNKIEKGFNTTDIYKEFCLAHEELSEACRAYYKK